jgi:hypothetical protein
LKAVGEEEERFYVFSPKEKENLGKRIISLSLLSLSLLSLYY